MATRLREIEDSERGKLVLRVEGELQLDDVLLLEKIALERRTENKRNLTIDLADVDFLDSESAPVIRRLQSEHGFEIEGLELFTQKAVEEAEKRDR